MLKPKKVYHLKRTPLKRGTSILKRTPLKRSPIKKKAKPLREIENEKKDKEKMWKVFLEIWNERRHYSEISGEWLGNEPLTTMFDHLLEKSVYSEYKFEKWNILLITPDEHTMKTNGFPLEEHQKRIDRAFIIHEKLKDGIDR